MLMEVSIPRRASQPANRCRASPKIPGHIVIICIIELYNLLKPIPILLFIMVSTSRSTYINRQVPAPTPCPVEGPLANFINHRK